MRHTYTTTKVFSTAPCEHQLLIPNEAYDGKPLMLPPCDAVVDLPDLPNPVTCDRTWRVTLVNDEKGTRCEWEEVYPL